MISQLALETMETSVDLEPIENKQEVTFSTTSYIVFFEIANNN